MRRPPITTSAFLMRDWDAQANRDAGLDPTTLTFGSHKRAYWRCPAGHEWSAVIGNRSRGSGCPQCKLQRTTRLPSITQHSMYAEYAPDLNGRLDPETISQGSAARLWWRCARNHEWQASPGRRSRGHGCPRCAVEGNLRRRWDGLARTVADDPTLARRLADVGRDPHSVPMSSREALDWWCAERKHIIRATPSRIWRMGCQICDGRIASAQRNLAVEYPDLAAEWHPTRNAIDPSAVLSGSNYAAWWLGVCGHEWQREVYVRRRGQRCPFCFGMATAPSESLAVLRPDLMQEWHPGNEVDPSALGLGSNQVVSWQCAAGHHWRTSIANRAQNGTRCPGCHRLTTRSAREIRLAHELAWVFMCSAEPSRIEAAAEWSVDFASAEHRLVVEYDGANYHAREGYPERDQRKTADLMEHGWTVLRVRERPLLRLNAWDVLCSHSGRISPVVVDTLHSLTCLAPNIVEQSRAAQYLQDGVLRAATAAEEEIEARRRPAVAPNLHG